MKAKPNYLYSMITDWNRREIANIEKCRGYFPKFKGFYEYKCECGFETRYFVTEGVDEPAVVDKDISDKPMSGSKTPDKVYCPVCINKILRQQSNGKVLILKAYKSKEDALDYILNNSSDLKKVGALHSMDGIDEEEAKYEPFFLPIPGSTYAVPINRSYEPLFKQNIKP